MKINYDALTARHKTKRHRLLGQRVTGNISLFNANYPKATYLIKNITTYP